jgi:hypothetical protein
MQLSGLAPGMVNLSAFLIGSATLIWLMLKMSGRTTRIATIAWVCIMVLCLGYLAIDKLIGVGYTKGFYAVLALTLATGTAGGFALRRTR